MIPKPPNLAPPSETEYGYGFAEGYQVGWEDGYAEGYGDGLAAERPRPDE